MNWRDKRVLVTGAGGFIGSHLAERLVELGAATRALVHYNALGSWGWLSESALRHEMTVVAGDVCDRDSVRAAMKDVDIVFHLAALIGIPYSYAAPASYVRANIEGTLNVLEAARELDVELVVHTSTSEVYGTARYVPIDEQHPLVAQSPYAASKIGADKLAEAYRLSFNVPIVTIRPFNTFGPRQSDRAVLPTIMVQCLAGGPVRLGHVHPRRDWNYVSNTVDGFIMAASAPGAVGRTINLGSGHEHSVGDAVQLVLKLVGRDAAIETTEERTRPDASEVDRLVADNTLALSVLGWSPAVSFEDGLKRTLDWVRQNAERFRNRVYQV